MTFKAVNIFRNMTDKLYVLEAANIKILFDMGLHDNDLSAEQHDFLKNHFYDQVKYDAVFFASSNFDCCILHKYLQNQTPKYFGKNVDHSLNEHEFSHKCQIINKYYFDETDRIFIEDVEIKPIISGNDYYFEIRCNDSSLTINAKVDKEKDYVEDNLLNEMFRDRIAFIK